MKAKIYTDGNYVVGGFKKNKLLRNFVVLTSFALTTEEVSHLEKYGYVKLPSGVFGDLVELPSGVFILAKDSEITEEFFTLRSLTGR